MKVAENPRQTENMGTRHMGLGEYLSIGEEAFQEKSYKKLCRYEYNGIKYLII